MADRIDVPLGLADFDVTGCEVVDGTLEVSVSSTRRPACHHCGSVSVTGHGRNERRLRDRSYSYPCVLRWSQRRFRCNDCDQTFRETHPAVAGKRRATERFRRHLFERACHEPFTDVAASERVSNYRVEEAFEAHATAELVDASPEPPRVLSLDESAFRKRRRFHTVFSDPERGVVLDLVEGRGKGAVFGGLVAMSDQVRAGIETVVMDCHWPYRRAIEEVLPDARIVVDKFHIIRAVDAAAQRVRMRVGRRRYRQRIGHQGGVARQHNPANNPTVYRSRWVFMKRANKLTVAEREWLWAVFEASVDELRRAWALKELFAAIYEAPDRLEAERRLNEWIDAITRAGVPEFLNTWRQLQWWSDQILNHFDDRVTNSFAEGITNKIKVLKRRSYGFRDPFRYRQKVLLSCRRRSSRHG
ncbi:MAG TPA: ISL3 family transposase [Actinomycetota bacterium]